MPLPHAVDDLLWTTCCGRHVDYPDCMSEGYRVAVVGATGQVGTLMLALLRERGFPAREIVPFASERSVGRELEGGLVVQGLSEESIQGFDLALFSAGGAHLRRVGAAIRRRGCRRDRQLLALAHARGRAARRQRGQPRGARNAPRDHRQPELLDDADGRRARSRCTDEAGIERLVISTYQAVSGTGKRAVDELLDQSHALLHEREIAPPDAYAHQIAFNALPHAGSFAAGEDHTDEERKLINETRKILGDPHDRDHRDLRARARRQRPLRGRQRADARASSPPSARASCCDAAPGVSVLDDPAAALYPLAIDAAGQDDVFVGRIRRDPGHERALDLWIVADNLRKGAAHNAVQLAELLHERGLIAPRETPASA